MVLFPNQGIIDSLRFAAVAFPDLLEKGPQSGRSGISGYSVAPLIDEQSLENGHLALVSGGELEAVAFQSQRIDHWGNLGRFAATG